MSTRTNLPPSALLGPILITLLIFGLTVSAIAEETYQSSDGKLTFSYPRRWQAENAGDKIRLTASDGSRFLLVRDTLQTVPVVSAAADPELKRRAAEAVAPLLKQAEFTGAQPVTMDHGMGAVFRFRDSAKPDAATTAAVYIALVGKHSIVLTPEKAGQPNQSIGLATVFQSLAFTDELPRAPVPRQAPQTMPPGGSASISGRGTVSFNTQIAPIFKAKCEVCHRSTAPLGGFSVSSYLDVIKGGRDGALILPGRPDASGLMDYLTGKRDLMPKGGPPLPADQIALVRTWIAEGARQEIGGGTAGTVLPPGSMPSSATQRAGNPNQQRPDLSGTGTARRMAASTRASRAVANGPELLEGYSGHLIANDLSFTLRLRLDKTAVADWSLSPAHEIHYTGSYTGQDGNYEVTLTQTGAPVADQGKTLLLELRARGSQETGVYGLDGSRPRREIAELELSETRSTDKRTPSGPIRFGNPPNPLRRKR